MIGLSYCNLYNYYDLPTQLCSINAYTTRRTIKIIKYACVYTVEAIYLKHYWTEVKCVK